MKKSSKSVESLNPLKSGLCLRPYKAWDVAQRGLDAIPGGLNPLKSGLCLRPEARVKGNTKINVGLNPLKSGLCLRQNKPQTTEATMEACLNPLKSGLCLRRKVVVRNFRLEARSQSPQIGALSPSRTSWSCT